MDALRPQARRAMGREEEPSAALLDSQSIKTGPVRGGERGFDKGKKMLSGKLGLKAGVSWKEKMTENPKKKDPK